MADRKDSALTSATPVITDAVRGLDDPAGTPISVTFLLSAIYTLFKTSFDAVYAAIGSSGIGVNALINGGFRVAQRGTTFNSTTTPANSDDTFLLDRWNLLSDGNDIVDVSQETSATIADPAYNIKLDVETANKKFGIIQFLEQKDARRLINQSVSLSFKAKITGTTINAIRAAVIAWDGTADTLTSDVVSAWGAAGTNPTLVANWTYENTPAALTAPTTSWASYSIQNIAIDTASATNVAVFIWTDDVTMNVADFLHIADVKLEVGATATAFEFRSIDAEISMCSRYFLKCGFNMLGAWLNASHVDIVGSLIHEMRIAPTATLTTTTPIVAEIGIANRTGTASTVTYQSNGAKGVYIRIDGFSGATASNMAAMAGDYLFLNAEL